MTSSRPNVGSSTKLIGLACPNENCDVYQYVATHRPLHEFCDLCGHRLKMARVSVAFFQWMDNVAGHGD